jgi:hypothetical protein
MSNLSAAMLPNPPLQVPYKPHDNMYSGLSYVQQPLTGHYTPHPPPQSSHYAGAAARPPERPLLQHLQRRTQSFGAPAQHSLQETVHLRRKTPSGIESTTYEAAQYGTTARPTKHILLPAPSNLSTNGLGQQQAHWQKDPGVGIQFGPVSYGPPTQHPTQIPTQHNVQHNVQPPQPTLSRLDTSRTGLIWNPSPLGQMRSNSVGDLSMQGLQLMSPQHATPPPSQLNTPTGLTPNLGLLAATDQNMFLNYHTPQQQPPPAGLGHFTYNDPMRPNMWQQQYPSGIPINNPESQLGQRGIYSPTPQYSNVYDFKGNHSISVTPSYGHSHPQLDMYPGINSVSTAPYSLVSPVTDNEVYSTAFMPNIGQNPVMGRDQVFQWARKVYAALLESQQRSPKSTNPAQSTLYKSVGTSTHPHITRRQSYAGQPSHFAGISSLNALRNAEIMKGNATVEARKALGTLQQICEGSGWTWIDGMLIAGCLAYGLGELKNAEQWYQRILNQNPE